MRLLLRLLFLLSLLNVSQVGGAGIDKRSKIAVLDTGIRRSLVDEPYMCRNGVKFAVGKDGYDTNGHGSHIIQILGDRIDHKTHCIISVRSLIPEKDGTTKLFDTIRGLEIAKEVNATFLNLSFGGQWVHHKEESLIREFVRNGTAVAMAAGNYTTNLDHNCNYFPACYKIPGAYIVGNGISINHRDLTSNYGLTVTDWRNGQDVIAGNYKLSGSSQSTALLLSEIVTKTYTKIKKLDNIEQGENHDDNFWRPASDLLRRGRHDNPVESERPSRKERYYLLPW